MANAVKIFDSDLQDGARVATPEETKEINASTGFINKESVLNDGQLTDEEKSNLESSACNDNILCFNSGMRRVRRVLLRRP